MGKNMDRLELRKRLSGKLGMNDIHECCYLTQGDRNNPAKEELYRLIYDEEERVGINALWVFTHFARYDAEWLQHKQDELIERVMQENNHTKKRLLLTLLERQTFTEDRLHTDFIDFCLTRIPSAAEPYAVRALCMKLAYKQCVFYKELLAELKVTLEILSGEPLSPGLASASRQVMKQINIHQALPSPHSVPEFVERTPH